ncbi:hypothetical protein ACNOYE_39485 [Nannocystaceae bacterium ST9]
MHRLAVPLCALLLASACTHLREHRPGREPIGTWIDEPTAGTPSAAADADRLAELERSGWQGRVIRLDRLLDLYDAARFAQDEPARETLWLALGGSASTRGLEASREAVLRMLDEAYALEEEAGDAVDEDQRRFVADAIALLSADLFLPDSAESLVDQLLGYRMLGESGHPRIADNARFRLYDFVRGVLEGGLEVGPDMRDDVVVHALYVEREDIAAWLEDGAPHARPALPSAEQLWALIEAQRAALAELPRWQAVLDLRAEADAELRETTRDLLPRPRDPSWALTELPRGTGEPESLAPIVLLRPGELVLEPGGADALTLAPESGEARERIEGLLARDGRGTLLLAADPELPSPEFAAGLDAMIGARVSTIELAVHEPRIGDEPGVVVVALPLHIVHADELSPGARAIRESRIHVRLSGRGTRVAIDDRWLAIDPALPSDLRSLVARLHEAYPRERVIRLSLDRDVQPRQLIELIAAFVGGRSPAFVAIGWPADQPLLALPEARDDAADRTLALRAALAKPGAAVLDLAVELPVIDRARIDDLARDLAGCVPELERALPKTGLTITLSFADGKLERASAKAKGASKPQLAAVEACVDEATLGLRLREHREPLTLGLRFSAAGG